MQLFVAPRLSGKFLGITFKMTLRVDLVSFPDDSRPQCLLQAMNVEGARGIGVKAGNMTMCLSTPSAKVNNPGGYLYDKRNICF